MVKEKKYKQLGAYGLLINDDKILLIKKMVVHTMVN